MINVKLFENILNGYGIKLIDNDGESDIFIRDEKGNKIISLDEVQESIIKSFINEKIKRYDNLIERLKIVYPNIIFQPVSEDCIIKLIHNSSENKNNNLFIFDVYKIATEFLTNEELLEFSLVYDYFKEINTLKEITERYGIDVHKVDSVDNAGFIVENNELKKSIIDDVVKQFQES